MWLLVSPLAHACSCLASPHLMVPSSRQGVEAVVPRNPGIVADVPRRLLEGGDELAVSVAGGRWTRLRTRAIPDPPDWVRLQPSRPLAFEAGSRVDVAVLDPSGKGYRVGAFTVGPSPDFDPPRVHGEVEGWLYQVEANPPACSTGMPFVALRPPRDPDVAYWVATVGGDAYLESPTRDGWLVLGHATNCDGDPFVVPDGDATLEVELQPVDRAGNRGAPLSASVNLRNAYYSAPFLGLPSFEP